MSKQGYVAAVASAASMDAQVRMEVDKWVQAGKQAGINPE